MLRYIFLHLSQQPALRDFALRFQFAQRMARRFVAGETLEEAIQTVHELNERGRLVMLNCLGENVLSRRDVEQVTATYCHIFDQIDQTGVRASVAVTPTQ